MNKKVMFLLKLVVGISILGFLLYMVGFQKIIGTILTVNYVALIIVFLTIILNNIIGPWNILVLSNKLKKISFLTMLKYYILSWSLGLFVLGKIGEFSIIYFLRKEGLSTGEAFVVSILDKFITFVTLVIISIFGFFLFFEFNVAIRLILVLILIIILFLFFMITNLGRNLIKKYILRKYAYLFQGFFKTFSLFFKKYYYALLLNFILTIIKWIIMTIGMWALFWGFGQTLSFIDVLLVFSIGTIVSLIPISVSGLGIRESAFVFLFAKLGVSAEVTASVALIILVLNYVTAILSLIFFRVEDVKYF